MNSLLKRKKTGGSGATLSYSTVKRKAAVLSAMLSQAVRWNLLSTNPMARVQIKNQTTGSAPQGPKCFTQEQAEKFLLLLDNVQTYAYGSRSRIDTAGKIYQVSEYQSARTVALQLKFLFYLAMFTGCRRGELLALQWSDLDFDKGSVSISKSLCYADGKKIIKPTKTNHDRSISIPQIVLTLGKQWKHEQNLYRLSIGSQWINEDNVFIRWNGDSMGLDTPYKAFHRILKHYNATRQQDEPALPLIPFHGLRHPYVKHTTKIFSLRLMDFQAQAYPDARRKTRGACQLRRGGQSQSPVHPLCNRKRFSYLPPQSKISRILYAISMRLSGYTSTRSISSSASSVVSASASKIALDASFRLSCRACSSCFCFACANTAA